MRRQHCAYTAVVLGTPPSGTSDGGDEESDDTRPVSSGEPPVDVLAELLAAARAARRDGDAQAGRFEDVLARRHDEFLGRYGQRALDEALTLHAAAMARAVLAARHYGEVRSWPGAATGPGRPSSSSERTLRATRACGVVAV
jgi:hypothetical protein